MSTSDRNAGGPLGRGLGGRQGGDGGGGRSKPSSDVCPHPGQGSSRPEVDRLSPPSSSSSSSSSATTTKGR